MKSEMLVILVLALPAATLAAGQDALRQPPQRAMIVAQAKAEMSTGEVRKIDKDAQKMTIKHGALRNLDMPPMTMVFRVQDPALLEKVKAGDKIRFRAERIGGAYTVTAVENVK